MTQQNSVKTDSSTKDRILDEAELLLQERGYNGFSYKHIAQKLGIKNAAIHYYFPGKADLGTALISRFRTQFKSWVRRLETKFADDFEKQLDGFIAIPKSFIKKNGLVCPLGILEADYNILPDSMRSETVFLSREMRSWLTDLLARGCEQKAFQFIGTAQEKALMISAALQGATFMVGPENPALFDIIVKQIKLELGLNS